MLLGSIPGGSLWNKIAIDRYWYYEHLPRLLDFMNRIFYFFYVEFLFRFVDFFKLHSCLAVLRLMTSWSGSIASLLDSVVNNSKLKEY
jgi:hypothetical protein